MLTIFVYLPNEALHVKKLSSFKKKIWASWHEYYLCYITWMHDNENGYIICKLII